MQFYRKTRKGFGQILLGPLLKIFVLITVLMIIIFLIGKLDLPTPYKMIKQKVPNEKFKVIK